MTPDAGVAARSLQAVLLLGAMVVGGACTEPVEFAEWMIPPGEGVPVREYVGADFEAARSRDAVRLVDELVIGSDLGNPDEALFRPGVMVGLADGSLFVADSATMRIQHYGPDGKFVGSLGREGQGPGEFGGFRSMTVAGDILVVSDRTNRRLSKWALDGSHLEDVVPEAGMPSGGRYWYGLADGTMVGWFAEQVSAATRQDSWTLAHLDPNGVPLATIHEYLEAPPTIPGADWTTREMGQAIIGLFDNPRRLLAVTPSGTSYLTAVHEYQVAAHSPGGETLWALRVAAPRPAIWPAIRDDIAWRLGDDEPFDLDALDWPSTYSAIGQILTDGAGRLHVIPNHYFEGDFPAEVPVDVFSPDGIPVAHGYVPARWAPPLAFPTAAWLHAAGDFVFTLRTRDDGELEVVRYRLVVETS